MSKQDILENDLMDKPALNYMDKHDSVNRTAETLIRSGTGVIAAQNLHGKAR